VTADPSAVGSTVVQRKMLGGRVMSAYRVAGERGVYW
jgi:hypothetical protein